MEVVVQAQDIVVSGGQKEEGSRLLPEAQFMMLLQVTGQRGNLCWGQESNSSIWKSVRGKTHGNLIHTEAVLTVGAPGFQFPCAADVPVLPYLSRT